MRKRLAVFSGYGVVTLALLAGTMAYVHLDKTVTISIDGRATSVRTFAGTVGAALKRAGVTVGVHDELSPSASTKLKDGATVTIARGRLIDLTIDGNSRHVWVTANSVSAALRQVGLRATGATVSVNRSARIPLSGMDIDVDLPHTFTVQVDGSTRVLVSAKPTLAAALTEAGIVVHPGDTVSSSLFERPTDGMSVVIVRITSGNQLETTPIPYTTVTKQDPNSYIGTKRIAQRGRAGTLTRIYQVTLANGVQKSKKLVSQQVTVTPIQQVVMVGTMPKPTPKVYQIKSDGLNWAALAHCESGGRANAYDPPFYGLYQFRLSTWRAVGGQGLPSDATPSEQTYRAQLLYARSNWKTQWPVCGHYLFS